MNTKDRLALMCLLDYCSDRSEVQDFIEQAFNNGFNPVEGKEDRFNELLDQDPEALTDRQIRELASIVDPNSHVYAAVHQIRDWWTRNPMIFEQHETYCPVCFSKNIEGDGVDIVNSVACQRCTCCNCDHVWIEHYQRVKNEPIKTN